LQAIAVGDSALLKVGCITNRQRRQILYPGIAGWGSNHFLLTCPAIGRRLPGVPAH